MKKFYLYLFCLTFFSLISCKKNYTCECVSIATVEAFGNKPNVMTSKNLVEARTLEKAKAVCEIDSLYQDDFMKVTTKCMIK